MDSRDRITAGGQQRKGSTDDPRPAGDARREEGPGADRLKPIQLFGARSGPASLGLVRPAAARGVAAPRQGIRLSRSGRGIDWLASRAGLAIGAGVLSGALQWSPADAAQEHQPAVADTAVPVTIVAGPSGAPTSLSASLSPALSPSLSPSLAPSSSPRLAPSPSALPARQPVFSAPEFVPSEVRLALARAGIHENEYGLIVRPLGHGRLTASHQPDEPFNPASTMKLVTTQAALALLGPDYRWVTSIHVNAKVDEGVLKGDLVLKGGGDPKFLIEDMQEVVRNLRASGLREIRGDLLVDDSLYAVGPERIASFDGEELAPYNVAPYAALMNFKSTRFDFDPVDGQLRMDPPLADVRIENDVRITRGRCHGAGIAVRDVGDEQVAMLRVSGQVSSHCGRWRQFGAALSHRQFIHGLFKAAWLESGGSWTGRTRVLPGAATGAPYYQWFSPGTLGDIVHDVNKNSNNVMARMLLLQIAANVLPRPAQLDDARRIVREYYNNQGLPMNSLVLDNGSGLSRIERISAGDLTSILALADTTGHAAIFENSLPQVGVDGTMKRRLRHAPVVGNAFIKTGTLNDVRAIAGYVAAASGERYAVTLLVNGPNAEGARRAQDGLLTWVYENG